MARTYNSRHRAESAAQTRQVIIDAAIRLHGEGITALAAVADAAGVSLPTVNKYFPTREDLFVACTTHFAAQLDIPAPETLSAIEDAGDRLSRVVHEVYRLHETTLGQMWLGHRLEDESPVLARALAEYDGIVAMLADTLPYDHASGDRDTLARFVYAALSVLTYRALTVKNGLSAEDAVTHMTLALAGVLNIEV